MLNVFPDLFPPHVLWFFYLPNSFIYPYFSLPKLLFNVNKKIYKLKLVSPSYSLNPKCVNMYPLNFSFDIGNFILFY